MILYYIILYHIILYHIILCYIILYYIILYYVILYYIIIYCITLFYIVLYYTILYYIVLCYIMLYYIISYYIIFHYCSLLSGQWLVLCIEGRRLELLPQPVAKAGLRKKRSAVGGGVPEAATTRGILQRLRRSGAAGRKLT